MRKSVLLAALLVLVLGGSSLADHHKFWFTVTMEDICGSGTTALAAERLGRRWLAMDEWEGAYDLLCERLAAEGLAAEGLDLGSGATGHS